jgi:hypothetical protein
MFSLHPLGAAVCAGLLSAVHAAPATIDISIDTDGISTHSSAHPDLVSILKPEACLFICSPEPLECNDPSVSIRVSLYVWDSVLIIYSKHTVLEAVGGIIKLLNNPIRSWLSNRTAAGLAAPVSAKMPQLTRLLTMLNKSRSRQLHPKLHPSLVSLFAIPRNLTAPHH